jgi:transcriptional regulator with XRE-family HTH domain
MKITKEQKREVIRIVGRNIKLYREAQGLTLLDLELLSGVPASNLSTYENGQVDFQITNLIAIATALNIPLSHLYPNTIS